MASTSSSSGAETSSIEEPCFGGELACCLDADGDGIANDDDNAPAGYNPQQYDFDSDGIGDVADSCVLTFSADTNGFDADRDGLGDGLWPHKTRIPASPGEAGNRPRLHLLSLKGGYAGIT